MYTSQSTWKCTELITKYIVTSLIFNIVCIIYCKHLSRVGKISMILWEDVLIGGQDVQYHGNDDEDGGRVGMTMEVREVRDHNYS